MTKDIATFTSSITREEAEWRMGNGFKFTDDTWKEFQNIYTNGMELDDRFDRHFDDFVHLKRPTTNVS